MFAIYTQTASTAGGFGSTFLMIAIMLAVLYFFMIRPENKKRKEMDNMRNALKVGDRITTIGGIMGTIVHVKDDSIVIETSADRVRLELAKWSVGNNNTAEAAAAAAKKEAAANKKKK